MTHTARELQVSPVADAVDLPIEGPFLPAPVARFLASVAQRLLPWAVPIGLIALWQIASSQGWLSTRVLPAPLEVVKAAWTLAASGELWTHEHGPQGGDEINRTRAGLNYGWPEVTYGREYVTGRKIGEGETRADVEPPVLQFTPSIAPSGMAFYDGDAIPEWKGAFLVGGLVTQGVVVLHMDGDKVSHEEHVPLKARIRDVKVAPDGSILLVTDEEDGQLLRITRSGES